MFKQQNEQEQREMVSVTLDGQTLKIPAGMSVTAALLAIGKTVSRISPSSHKPCSPHCLMGVCFECLMEIDGIQRQGCLVEVQEGLIINRRLNADEGERS
ncbi:MAG: (2Fe-2S)-binding protein [Desulfopila sp.]|nr:(2Fe-2S)-binding protein [Desulfopila sp.]